VVAVSGATDFVTDGTEVVAVPGGHLLMTRVTGVGCALGAVMAACCAVDRRPVVAAATASAVLAAAGERAAAGNPGPGTFAVRLLDALAALAAEVRPPAT
jgi:hydroxyethylthiazole kinase